MSYAHCMMFGSIPEGFDESLADSLLSVLASHPSAGCGVYVVAIAPSRDQARQVATVAVMSSRPLVAAL